MHRSPKEMLHKYATAVGAGHPAVQRPAAGRRAAYVFMTILAALASPVVHAYAPLAACDAIDTATVLHPAAEPARDARAYWLDRRLIQWPGVAVDGHAVDSRFRLYASATAALRAEPGRAVSGADRFVALNAVKAELPAVLAERFRFVGDGLRLQWAASDDVRIDELLRGQVLLVREDAQGRVLDATALQTPGALDDLYAAAESATLGAGRYGRPEISEDFATRFALWAPTAQAVSVCLYGDATRAFPARREIGRAHV